MTCAAPARSPGGGFACAGVSAGAVPWPLGPLFSPTPKRDESLPSAVGPKRVGRAGATPLPMANRYGCRASYIRRTRGALRRGRAVVLRPRCNGSSCPECRRRTMAPDFGRPDLRRYVRTGRDGHPRMPCHRRWSISLDSMLATMRDCSCLRGCSVGDILHGDLHFSSAAAGVSATATPRQERGNAAGGQMRYHERRTKRGQNDLSRVGPGHR